ncbi:CD3337/EF1877 family mobilome membrane protein (plasmid) [Staphylococcus xylosus]|uniref:CD3337/EF1877 family mobilome membrane protein n=1 Tax=Staphylococcus xylosus TaxID=1288 RepID=UPI00403E8271
MKKVIALSLVLAFILGAVLSINSFYNVSADSNSNDINKSITDYVEKQDKLKKQRERYKYDPLGHYGLMSHGTEKWYEFKEKTGGGIAVSIKDMVWMWYVIATSLVTEIVFQMFNLDIISLFQAQLQDFTSSLAGKIITNLVTFGMAVMSVYIVIKAYMKQDFGAFFKLLGLILLSLIMLFSIQSEKFNYIGIADTVSKSVENTIISVPFDPVGDSSSKDIGINGSTAVSMENKVFDALVVKPYLSLTYDDLDKSKIDSKRKKGFKVDDYLKASPFKDDGIKKRDEIAKYETEDMENTTISNANAWTIVGNIFIYFLGLVVQGFVFGLLSVVRIGLQFAFLLLLALLPVVLLMSFFPTLEKGLFGWAKAVGFIIIGKAMIVFFIVFVMAIMSFVYRMQDVANDSISVTIFFTIAFAIACIWVYFQRNTIMATVFSGGEISTRQLQRGDSNFANASKNTGNKARQVAGSGASGFKKGAGKVASGARSMFTNNKSNTKANSTNRQQFDETANNYNQSEARQNQNTTMNENVKSDNKEDTRVNSNEQFNDGNEGNTSEERKSNETNTHQPNFQEHSQTRNESEQRSNQNDYQNNNERSNIQANDRFSNQEHSNDNSVHRKESNSQPKENQFRPNNPNNTPITRYEANKQSENKQPQNSRQAPREVPKPQRPQHKENVNINHNPRVQNHNHETVRNLKRYNVNSNQNYKLNRSNNLSSKTNSRTRTTYLSNKDDE